MIDQVHVGTTARSEGRKYVAVLIAIIGFAGGVVGGLIARPAQKDSSKDVDSSENHVEVTPMPAARDLRTLLKELRAESQTPGSHLGEDRSEEQGAAEQDTGPGPTLGSEDLEAAREERLDRWVESLAAHDNEPVDHGWAAPRVSKLEAAYGELAQRHGFEFLQAKCKSKTCSAAVKWGTYEGALSGYENLLQDNEGSGCARSILLPEPEAPDRPYQATVLFDCSS